MSYAAGIGLLIAAAPAAGQQTVQVPVRDTPLRDQPTPVFTIGAEEGQSWELLDGVRAVAFDRADNLYVLDANNARVLMFDSRGRFVRQFGRRGGGPGEFQQPLGMTVTPDGNVVVSELMNRGFVIYRSDGEYVKNVPFAENYGMPMMRIESDPQGGIVARVNPRMAPGATPESAARNTISRHPLEERGQATEMYSYAVEPPQVLEQGQGRVMVRRVDPIFGVRPSFGVLPDGGLAVHHDPEYAVKLLDANGRHTRTITRGIQPKRVTRQDQEREMQRRRDEAASGAAPQAIVVTMGRGGGAGTPPPSPQQFSMRPEDQTFAEFMSVVTGIRTDPQGRIWIQRRNGDNTDQGPIDLVSVDGRYIGTLPAQRLPDAVSASGLAAWIVRDELGIERVAVRRLPQSWR